MWRLWKDASRSTATAARWSIQHLISTMWLQPFCVCCLVSITSVNSFQPTQTHVLKDNRCKADVVDTRHNINASYNGLYLVSKCNSVLYYLLHYMATACKPWVLSENSPRSRRASSWVSIFTLLTQQYSAKIILTMVTDAQRQNSSSKNASRSTVVCFVFVWYLAHD